MAKTTAPTRYLHLDVTDSTDHGVFGRPNSAVVVVTEEVLRRLYDLREVVRQHDALFIEAQQNVVTWSEDLVEPGTVNENLGIAVSDAEVRVSPPSDEYPVETAAYVRVYAGAFRWVGSMRHSGEEFETEDVFFETLDALFAR